MSTQKPLTLHSKNSASNLNKNFAKSYKKTSPNHELRRKTDDKNSHKSQLGHDSTTCNLDRDAKSTKSATATGQNLNATASSVTKFSDVKKLLDLCIEHHNFKDAEILAERYIQNFNENNLNAQVLNQEKENFQTWQHENVQIYEYSVYILARSYYLKGELNESKIILDKYPIKSQKLSLTNSKIKFLHANCLFDTANFIESIKKILSKNFVNSGLGPGASHSNSGSCSAGSNTNTNATPLFSSSISGTKKSSTSTPFSGMTPNKNSGTPVTSGHAEAAGSHLPNAASSNSNFSLPLHVDLNFIDNLLASPSNFENYYRILDSLEFVEEDLPFALKILGLSFIKGSRVESKGF